MKKIIIALFLVLISNPMFAAPSVSGVSGTLTHGQSITISGSGFGTKSVAAPALFDKVEGTYSTAITDGGIVPVRTAFSGAPQEATAPFEYNSFSGNHVIFEATAGYQRHSHSTACYRDDGTGGAWLDNAEDSPILGGTTTFTYLSWWIKTTNDWASYNNEGTSNKFLRIRDYNYDDAGVHTFTWQPPSHYIYSPSTSPACNTNHWDSTSWSSGWHFMEAIFNNTAGTYTLRKDNVATVTDQSWTCPFNFNTIQCIGWDANGTINDCWWDEIYFDGSASRVMIGNANTYASCTHLEMQPPSTWNANGQSITVTLNQGSFADSSTAYVYVFDSTNTPNSSGYEITFGGESSTPAPPTISNATISNGRVQ